MPLYIRDDDVRTMAQRLAEARGTTVTDAVREALRHELAGAEAAEAEHDQRVRALFAKWAEHAPPRPWTEADMYDEDGIAR